ncbi:MAG: hypothetical protein J1F17_06680 [Oscillospiraceae bacterium]|nr:hypothetical protein [Oscillospiraceae bacterium]
MKINEYKLNLFRKELSEINRNNEIKALLSNDDNMLQIFFELCSDYSHISINSEKVQTGAQSLGCLPFESDINIAVSKTIDFIKKYGIIDVEGLLSLILKLHPFAIKSEDNNKQRSRVLRADSNSTGIYGTYFKFNKLPEDTWILIKKQILKELK